MKKIIKFFNGLRKKKKVIFQDLNPKDTEHKIQKITAKEINQVLSCFQKKYQNLNTSELFSQLVKDREKNPTEHLNEIRKYLSLK